ncbi:MAG: hypothetical protein JXR46_06475 [Calditrichaceae bacterium]|nr:hypothetical protein [Calditrichaceae bacterium]MBN2708673.1 hypothetical protein [Calditrichaceae bacterium]RQV96760.1 MAG: hypothetical protein EH224_03545 [Calditrichota bacterium]
MLKLILKQPYNYWQSISVLQRIQTIIVVGLILFYYLVRATDSFNSWLLNRSVTDDALSNLLFHSGLFFIIVTTPLVLLYLVPKQKLVITLLTKPLSISQTFILFIFYILKFQGFIIILFLPAILAFSYIEPLWGVLSIFLFTAYCMAINMLAICMLIRIKDKNKYLLYYYSGFLVYLIGYAVFYLILPGYWFYDLFILNGFFMYSLFTIKRLNEIHPEIVFSYESAFSSIRSWQKTGIKRLPKIFPHHTQVLFHKEFFSLWRNPRYIRLKVYSFIFQIILSVLILIYSGQNKVLLLTILNGLLIWLHYSSYFNDKYTHPESPWFYKIFPLQFTRVWISKFAAEFTYIFVLLLSFAVFLALTGISQTDFFMVIALMLIFSILILVTMLNFQMIFFENPRYAGYAYHFTIIFFVVMSVNYRFVGPLMTLFIMIYFFYQNYKHFKA